MGNMKRSPPLVANSCTSEYVSTIEIHILGSRLVPVGDILRMMNEPWQPYLYFVVADAVYLLCK